MQSINENLFTKLIDELLDEPSSARKYLNSTDLTQIEKKILSGWFFLRDNKFDQVIASLSEIKSSYNDLISAHRMLLLGIAHNNRSSFTTAQKCIEQAISYFEASGGERHLFLAYYNYFIVGFNLKDKAVLEQSLDRISSFKPRLKKELIYKFDCFFNYHLFHFNQKKAQSYLVKLIKLEPFMTESVKASFLISKFQYYFKVKSYKSCYQTLAQIKKVKKYAFSVNYYFMKTLLDYILQDTSLYLFEERFKPYPELWGQVRVLRALDEVNLVQAETAWKQLQNLNPHLYQENFSYQSDGDLFSQALLRHQHLLKNGFKEVITNDGTKETAIIQLLQINQNPLPKEVIFKLVWQKELMFKQDELKLQKIISRLRSKYQLKIKSRKGCYFLDKKAS